MSESAFDAQPYEVHLCPVCLQEENFIAEDAFGETLLKCTNCDNVWGIATLEDVLAEIYNAADGWGSEPDEL